MDKSGLIGEISENLGGIAKQAVKQVVKTPVDLTKTGVAQVKGDVVLPEAPGMTQSAASSMQGPVDPGAGDKKIEQEIKDGQDLAKARNELHSIYYQNLVNPKKQEEERVVEKLEREEKQKEFEELEEKSKNPQPLPQNLRQGTGEKAVNVSG